MIHMKSLIRRLDCVPWLLAACALVWAGEATAQIALSLDKYEINERQGKDGASVELTVTAKAAAAAAGDAFVELSLTGIADNRISVGALDRLKIPDTKDSGSLTLKIFPRDDADASTNVEITITVTGTLVTGAGVKAGGYTPSAANDGTGTGDVTIANSAFRLIDDDGPSTRVRLTVDTQDLKDESDAMNIKVIATLDRMKITSAGATAADNVDRELKFQLAAVQIAQDQTVLDQFLPGEYGDLFDGADPQPKYARRDEHYDIPSYKEIKIAADKTSGEVTLNIDPKSFPDGEDGPLYIMIGARDADAASLLADAGNIAEGSVATDATDLPIVPALIKITKGDVAQVKSIVAIPSGRDANMLREDAGETTIQLLVTLENAAGDDGQPVAISLNDVTGNRDEDYQVRLGPSLKVEAGKTTGIVEVYVTPEDDGNKDDAQFEVIAEIPGRSRAMQKETITIVDDDKDTKNISLTGVVQVDGRDNLEIYEEDGSVTIEVTATVDGVPLETDAAISLTLAPGGDAGSGPGSATRDVDYDLDSRTFVIKAGESFARTEVTIIPKDDGKEEKDNETIILGDLNALAGKGDDPTADLDPKVAVGELTITLKDGADPDAPKEEEDEEEEEAVFALVDEETDIMGTVGEALTKQLPAATGSAVGEDADVTYLLNSGTLPAGLAFDGDARTISGTPSASTEEAVEVTYYATDGTNIATLDYSISIAPTPDPEIDLAGISSSHTLLRENAGHATTITLTVTLDEAPDADTKVELDFAAPREGDTAARDEEFTAAWDADQGRVVSIAKGSTTGTAKVSVTPTNNSKVGSTAFTVQATSASGSQAKTDDIVIADDESSSSAIVLSVDPDSITEGDGETSVIVTATLSGGGLEEDTTVTVGIAEGESSATRDSDYSADFASGATRITIAAGDLNGQTSVSITPTSDADAEEGAETIVLTGMASGLATGSAQITLNDAEAMAEEDMEEDMDDGEEEMDDGEEEMDDGEEEMMGFAFAGEVADQAYTAGAAITPLVLPEATGGEGDVTYRAFDLPAGLAFDAATRTVSGTPEAAGTAEVTVLAQDSAGAAATLVFNVTVNPALSFGDLFGAAGKANPASEHGDADFSVIVGQELTLPLPAVTGGTPPLTYSVAGLPAGLSFDPATRVVSGTPEAITAEPVVVTYTITDANGQTIALPILVAVIPPPLAAPPNLVFEAYTGADGQGIQGGFVLLTWELSEHHAGIDGYRIYRELPVLGNEMVPWAFVDAVPEVEVGRAIVAMLDGVDTSWGIAAERGGQTTSIVSGNQAGKRVPGLAGLNADARMYLDARTALPSVGEEFVLDVNVADLVAVDGYGLQVQYDASKLEFIEVRTDQLLGRVTPQVLDEAGILTVAAYGDVVSDGEVALSLVFRPTTEIENTVVEIIDSQMYDSEFGFNHLALPLPLQVQTRPAAFALANNYPNPFNPETTIKYALPQAADVELTVYNVVGQVVRTLVAEHQSAGRYVVEWDATNDSGRSLSSGMYFYRLEAGGEFLEVKKMLLLK